MDSRYGGFAGHGPSRPSRYSHSANHQDEDDNRQPQHRRGGRKGHQCQYCGLEFRVYNDMIHHAQTDCMVRYSSYPKDLPPGTGEGHSVTEMHFAAASRDRSATRPGHSGSNAFGSIESSTHGSGGNADYSNRASSSGLPPEGFDATTITPLRRQEQQVQLTHDGSDTHSSRSVSFSPTSGQGKTATRELQKDSLSQQKLLDEPQPLFRLLNSGELSSLSVQDRALCQSVVLFCSKGGSSEKTSGDDKFGHRSQSYTPFQSFDSPPRAGPVHSSQTTKSKAGHASGIEGKLIVGFQCAFCMSNLASPSQGGTPFARVFPGSIETIAASLNLVKERHFQSPPRTGSKSQTPSPSGGQGGCLCLPSDIRSVFEDGRNQSSYKPPEIRYEETMALQVACQNLAHRLGVDNKQPHKTGIVVQGSASKNKDITNAPQFDQHEAPLQNRHFSSTGDRKLEFLAERYALERRPASSGSVTFGYGLTMEHAAAFDTHHPPILSHRTSQPTRPEEAMFVRDSYGWCCPYCSTLPYNFRSPGYFTREPPAADFMNKHFAVCTGLSGGERNYDEGGRVPHGTQYSYPHGYPYPPDPYGGPQSGRSRAPPYYASAYDRSDQGQGDRFCHSQLAVQHFRGHGSSPMGSTREATEASISQAIDFLASLDEENPDEGQLVLPDDKLLLTDYFFYLNKQLKECRFTEKDRKTRGGKREKIELGFGGLQCRHCAGTSGSRKFFWSDVDRLANSFAEIPGHILKCRKCPDEVKNALTELKLKHPEQMARLPRGSQKVFFRRMWKRLHRQGLDSAAQIKSSPTLKLEGGAETTPEDRTFSSDSLKRSATHNEREDPKRQRCDESPGLDQL